MVLANSLWVRCLVLVPLVLSHLTLAVPSWSSLGRQVRDVNEVQPSYDYIIVGGGTAGLTIADRLTESGKYNASDPSDFPASRVYNITSVPQVHLNNQSVPMIMGHCVGGSSAINGMAVMRGTAQEYDNWAELGNEGSTWNWKEILPYFRKAIHFVPPEGEWVDQFNVTYDLDKWGQYNNTRVYTSFLDWFDPIQKVIYDAWRRVPGIPVPKDGADGTGGLFYFPISVHPRTKQRSYARTGHWDGLHRKNYDIVTGSRVNKILFSGNKASGVRFVPKDGPSEKYTIVRVNREIVISAGSVHTPQVLQLSGIGPAKLLKEANIDVIVDLPGVGSNFQDHPLGPLLEWKWGKEPERPFNHTYTGPVFGFGSEGSGIAAKLALPIVAPNTYETLASRLETFEYSTLYPETPAAVLAGLQAQQKIYAREMRRNKVSFASNLLRNLPVIQPVSSHIFSRGTIMINATDPESEPLVDFRALSNPLDLDIWVSYLRFLHNFILTSFPQYSPTIITPQPGNFTSPSSEHLKAYIKKVYAPHGWHPVGTAAKMKREYGGVVDDELRVYGTQGLRVADASIFPTLISASLQLTVYTVGEKAAGLIMGEW